MKTLFLPVLTVSAVWIGASSDLSYAPERGTTLTKVFSQERRLTMDELVVVMNGVEIPAEYMPAIDLEIVSEGVIGVNDRVLEVANGRPVRLERSFVELDAAMSESFTMSPAPTTYAEASGTSRLNGLTVSFVWDPDTEEYDVELVGEETDLAAPLDGLVEDMDMRAFLPSSGGSAIGDLWELDATVLQALFEPGGDMAWDWEKGEAMRGSLDREDPELSGSLTATLSSLEDDVALIELSGTCETVFEHASNLDGIPIAQGTTTVVETTTFEIAGTLSWNVANGHVDGLDLSADVAMTIETEKDPGQEGQEYESTMTFSGTWECAVTVATE